MSDLKTHIKSFVLTFIAAFAIAVLPALGDTSWTKATLLAICIAGLKAGFKALDEYTISSTNLVK